MRQIPASHIDLHSGFNVVLITNAGLKSQRCIKKILQSQRLLRYGFRPMTQLDWKRLEDGYPDQNRTCGFPPKNATKFTIELSWWICVRNGDISWAEWPHTMLSHVGIRAPIVLSTSGYHTLVLVEVNQLAVGHLSLAHITAKWSDVVGTIMRGGNTME